VSIRFGRGASWREKEKVFVEEGNMKGEEKSSRKASEPWGKMTSFLGGGRRLLLLGKGGGGMIWEEK